MIKNALKDKQVHLSIDNLDFSYRIPIKKIGNTVDWRIGEKGKGKEGIVTKNVSTWTLQLFTKNTTEEEYIKQFKDIVQEHAPNNIINWDATLMAVNIQNEYNSLVKENTIADTKISEEELILSLKKKYKLD
jgi:hypothetical protein